MRTAFLARASVSNSASAGSFDPLLPEVFPGSVAPASIRVRKPTWPQVGRLSEAVFDPADRRRLACLLHTMRRLHVPLSERRILHEIVHMHRDRTLTLIRTISEITAKMQRRHKQAMRIWDMLRMDMDVVAKMQRHHKETLNASLEAHSTSPGVGGPENLAFEPGCEPGWDQLAVLFQAGTRISARLLMSLRRLLELQARHAGASGSRRLRIGWRPAARKLRSAMAAIECRPA